MRKRLGLIPLLLFSVTTPAQATSEELVSLDTRPGVQQRFILIKPDNPQASVILFAGGKGTLRLGSGLFGGVTIDGSGNNFLVRSRDKFAAHHLMVAVVDAPSDRQGRRGMLGDFRASDDHVQDIDAVIAHLRRTADIPVWLVGTSRGTESAAHVAIYSGQSPHGLVLTSAMSESNDNGYAVPEMAISRIRLPTLIAAHEGDGCHVTPPDGAEAIRAGMSGAGTLEIKYFNGGREEGRPCKAMSHHGFLGIEDEVVNHIATFIETH